MTRLIGSAPGRAQPAYLRPRSFKSGHAKRGGRKRGTPNVFPPDYKKAIVEAAERIGNDGNGRDGLVGYFSWVALRHPRIFSTVLLINVLPLEFAESNTPEEPRRTMEEVGQWVREYIGFAGKGRKQQRTVSVDVRSPSDWTGQPFPVSSLMRAAVADPKGFSKLFGRIPAAHNKPWPTRPRDRPLASSSRSAIGRRARALREASGATKSSKSMFLRTTLWKEASSSSTEHGAG
jgi:hypothetical protein